MKRFRVRRCRQDISEARARFQQSSCSFVCMSSAIPCRPRLADEEIAVGIFPPTGTAEFF